MGHTNTRLFWLINLAVWIIYYVMQGTTAPVFLEIEPVNRIFVIIHFLMYIMLITGLYRFIYQKYVFWTKTLVFTFFQAMISAVLMCLLDVYLRFVTHEYLSILEEPLLARFGLSVYEFKGYSDNIYHQVDMMKYTDSNIAQYVKMSSVNGQITKFMAYVIWTFAFNAYRYSANLIEARVEKFRYEGQLKEAELINLRSQLNPHFLFNSLNSIHAMTMMKRDEASDAVLLLSDLMRYTLNYEKKDVVTVEEEMATVEKYLKLEKIRFGEKLNYSFDLQENTLDKKIPLLVIQTLAENAIKHAIGRRIEGGHVQIKSFLENDNLIVEVINSGQLPEQTPSVTLLHSSQPLVREDEPKKSGIGIENTRRRLAMIYGDKAFFNLTNWGISEVKAMMRIPILH